MEILLAKNAGFCFGVRRAVETAKSAVKEKRSKDPCAVVYTYGELIHNRTVVEELRKEGIVPIDSLESIKEGDSVVIRSHGVGERVYDILRARGANIIDATCPFVANIHRIVNAAYAAGERVFIVGDKNHPEPIGINGFCAGSAEFIESIEDLEKLKGKEGILVVQTTFDSKLFAAMEKRIREEYPGIRVNNTICNTTLDRQAEAEQLSRKCGAILVLGDRHSSNTKKLLEICKKNCISSKIVSNKDEIPIDLFKNPAIIIGIVAGASTPDSIIWEVIRTMSEQDKANAISTEAEIKETATAEEAAKNIEDIAVFDEDAITKTIVRIRPGQILTGTVIQIVDGEVSVNIGYKSDGYIPRNEFSNDPEADPAASVKPGDEIEVEVLKVNDGEGNVLLSRKNVESQKAWEEFSADAESEGKILDGVCKEAVKGGVIVVLDNGARAFVPASQIANKYVADLNEYVGQPMKIKVLEVDPKRKRIVGSHKAVLRKEAEEAKKAIWNELQVGEHRNGIVRRLTNFGAFVDIGGVDGLLHVTQCSWDRSIKNPADVLEIGQQIEVVIREIDAANKKVSLGYKELLPKPWETAEERYPVGSIVEGKVVRIVDFGAFVALEPTIDGLIHISQISIKRFAKIEDELQIGDIVRCKVLSVDTAKKRISLSRKEAFIEEHPEEAQAIIDEEKAARDKVRQERQEKRQQEEEARKEAAAARDARRKQRDEQRAERQERRHREEPDYELPPVEASTTSLASLFGNIKFDEEGEN